MEAIFDSLNSISHESLGLLVNSLAISVLIVGVVLIMWRLVRPRDAATSYVVWWAILSAVVVLPVAACMYAGSGSQAVPNTEFTQLGSDDSSPAVPLERQNRVEKRTELPATNSREQSGTVRQKPESEPTNPALRSGVRGEERSLRSGSEMFIGMLPLFVFVLWTAAVLALLFRIARSYFSVLAVKKRSRPFRTDQYLLFEKIKCRTARGRKTVVAETEELDLPAAAGLGHPVILIPSEVRRRLSDDELEGILLHELMHLERYDDGGRLLQTVIRAIFFFHPAVYWITSQLDIEREIACDDRVVDLTGRADDYAECLSKMAEMSVANRTSLIPGALEDRRQLFRRFKRLLHADRPTCTGLSRGWLAGSVVGLILTLVLAIQIGPVMAIPGPGISYADLGAFVAAASSSENSLRPPARAAEPASHVDEVAPAEPAPPAERVRPSSMSAPATPASPSRLASGVSSSSPSAPAAPAQPMLLAGLGDGPLERLGRWAEDVFTLNLKGTSISHYDDGTITYRWSDGRREIRAKLYGDIELSDDDRSIKSLSDDGYLTIQDRRGRDRKEIDIEVGSDSDLLYTYYSSGKAEEFDDAAADWLGEVLLEMIRLTGIGAEQRVERIFNQDGVAGVLREVELIESGYVSRIYLEALLVEQKLSPEEFDEVMVVAARELDSDYETAELLIAVAPLVERDERLLEGWIGAVEDIDSDYETRRVLNEVSISKRTPAAVILSVLRLAEQMDSDYEKAELLIDLSRLIGQDAETSSAYVRCVETMDSDYEKRRVLSAISVDESSSPETIQRVIGIADGMSSDYEKSELLIELVSLVGTDQELSREYIDAIVGIDSDYEKKRIIEALSQREPLSARSVDELLTLIEKMDSDYEKAEVLISLSRQTRDQQLSQKLLDAVRTIDSDYERRRVITAHDFDCASDEAAAIGLLQAARDMEGDYEKAEVMLELIDCVEASDSAFELFLDVVDGFSSDYERERVVDAVIDDIKLSDDQVIRLLRTVGLMTSDYEKAQVLGRLVKRCREDESLKEAFADVLETIESEYEADKLYGKLYRKSRRGSDDSQ